MFLCDFKVINLIFLSAVAVVLVDVSQSSPIVRSKIARADTTIRIEDVARRQRDAEKEIGRISRRLPHLLSSEERLTIRRQRFIERLLKYFRNSEVRLRSSSRGPRHRRNPESAVTQHQLRLQEIRLKLATIKYIEEQGWTRKNGKENENVNWKKYNDCIRKMFKPHTDSNLPRLSKEQCDQRYKT